MKLPNSRNSNVVVQPAGDEILIYDLKTNKAYCLNETSAAVYRACDGQTDFERFKESSKMPEEIIQLALRDLREKNLVEDTGQNFFGSLTRREIVRKVGLASLVALPMITTLVAPTAAQTGSCLPDGSPCSDDAQCCSTVCGGTCGPGIPGGLKKK